MTTSVAEESSRRIRDDGTRDSDPLVTNPELGFGHAVCGKGSARRAVCAVRLCGISFTNGLRDGGGAREKKARRAHPPISEAMFHFAYLLSGLCSGVS